MRPRKPAQLALRTTSYHANILKFLADKREITVSTLLRDMIDTAIAAAIEDGTLSNEDLLGLDY